MVLAAPRSIILAAPNFSSRQIPMGFIPVHVLCSKPGFLLQRGSKVFLFAFCNEDPHDTYYIGDMESDMFCANRAGVDFIHANYGYGQVKCELSVNQIEQILSL